MVMPRWANKDDVLDLMEALLKAQLETIQEIRRIRTAENDSDYLGSRPVRKRLSYEDMAYAVLAAADHPLHVGEIVKRIREAFGELTTRESLASVLTRGAKLGERFQKVGPNTYTVVRGELL